MSNIFKIVKKFYDKGIYSKEDVGVFVKAKRITGDEYKRITGDDYIEDEE